MSHGPQFEIEKNIDDAVLTTVFQSWTFDPGSSSLYCSPAASICAAGAISIAGCHGASRSGA